MKNKNVLIVLGILVVVAIAFFMLNKKFAIQKTADGLPAAAVKSTGSTLELDCNDPRSNCLPTNKTIDTSPAGDETDITPKTVSKGDLGCDPLTDKLCDGMSTVKLSCDPSTGAICDPTIAPTKITAIPTPSRIVNENAKTIQIALGRFCSYINPDGQYGPKTTACIDYARVALGLLPGKIDAALLGKLNIEIAPSTLRESPTRAEGKPRVAEMAKAKQYGFIVSTGSGYVPAESTRVNISETGQISLTNIANQTMVFGSCSSAQ